MDHGKKHIGICLTCWEHISEFDIFKKSVILAQTKHAKELNMRSLVIKEEKEDDDEEEEKGTMEFITDPNNDSNGIYLVVAEGIGDSRNNNGTKRFKFTTNPDCPNDEITAEYVNISDHPFESISNDHQLVLYEENHEFADETTKQTPSVSSIMDRSRKRKARRKIKANEFLAEWREKLKCNICQEPCLNLTSLRRHFLKSHPSEKCVVNCCNRQFDNFDLIEDHIRLHIDPYNSFRCEVCGKIFSNCRILCDHLVKMHSDEHFRSYNCPKCGKRFHSKERRTVHLENYCTNMCRECGQIFGHEFRRKLHERAVHNMDTVCKRCHKDFPDKRSLRQHLEEHIENGDSGSDSHMCSDCGKIHANAKALREHKREIHHVRNLHKCSVCKEIFSTPISLREHMSTHTGTPLYTCPFCPLTFHYRSRLHYHRRSEHPNENVDQISKCRENGHETDEDAKQIHESDDLEIYDEIKVE